MLPINEPVLNYAPQSKERLALENALADCLNTVKNIPMYIGNEPIETDVLGKVVRPDKHETVLAQYHIGTEDEVHLAIRSALNARELWRSLSTDEKARIFLKAADLAAGPYRMKLNAATMLGQSKNAYQAEIDAACELVDFFRFNVHFMREMELIQPISGANMLNSMDYRPLEGFVLAITPFNFTAIAGNLPAAPAMLGNVVVWKPSETQLLSASIVMELLIEAGLPAGVINMVIADGPTVSEIALAHPEFSGLHFTGSTKVFKHLWQKMATNIDIYKNFPRIVGETGGKDFVLAHGSANVSEVVTALVRGAFEYQGQKCSAASRAYLPASLWQQIKEQLLNTLVQLKMGEVTDFSKFINAVIDEKAFDRITAYIDRVKDSNLASIIAGGNYDKSKGYFIEPTVIHAIDPMYETMQEELFGPVLTVYVYSDEYFEEVLSLIDQTSAYALTGCILANDRYAISLANKRLINAAGNFYINDKPTGAVVGQQPFGGARMSGTNDKSGSMLNLLRWVNTRTVKETFVTPRDYKYPFLG